MKLKAGFRSCLLGVAFLLVLAGCSSGTSNEVDGEQEAGNEDVVLRVAWWGGQERHDMTIEAIELFEEKYPHIQVDPEFTSWDNYWERLTTQAAGNNLPDVIQMDNSKLNEYSSRGLVIDLQSLIADGTINLDDVDDVYQDMNVQDGSVWAVSAGSNALAAIYNEEMLEEQGIQLEPGYTYEDFYEAMQTLKENIDGDFYGYDFGNAEYEMFFVYARQNGESFYNEDGTGLGFENQTLIDFLTFVKQMVDDGVAPPHALTLEYIQGGESLLGDQMAGAAMAASNGIIGLQQSTEHQLGLMLLPSLDGGVHGNWIRPSMSYSISSHSEQQEAAALFIDFLTNDLEANEILKAERGVPISSKVREHLAPMVDGPIAKTFEFLELVANYTSPADPLPPPGESEVRGAFLRMIESVKYERLSIEEATEQFRQEAEQILR
ncbi:ABC transporter substrate-binding protein [Halalkalibacterium halodurans]|jgi:multiple sugar transport system substrate-binding protein|uniref:Lactose ABC transporter substrate-binding protein n=2 Tax=Halalkalibacterium halodurans TaxID=86665 RepID=A0A0M0KMF3_ALKHA|nr:ABC transporter substrate-binding protein [Halalkalibacterium halodurans]TPE70767.1 carbohydrate ABC transporter substrate-binding protein [Halalkalibacterium halodurans]